MTRSGLRIRGARGHPEVRGAYVRYAKWLRKNYEFPIRCPVYLYPSDMLLTRDGKLASAIFFGPYDRNEEPNIRIATGDYPDLERADGRDNALASYIHSFSHEIVHYIQWCETGNATERGVERKADSMLRRYTLDVDRP